MAYLEPNRVHHVRDYAQIVIRGFRALHSDSWSAAALEENLRRRERHQDWHGFRSEVVANAEHLFKLERAAQKLPIWR